jgi:hypothetical protein
MLIIQDKTKLDLVCQFSKAKHDVILKQVQELWESPDSISQHQLRGTK